MPLDFPEEFEVFQPGKVPDERELVKLKLRKLILYGYLIIIPITGLLISFPYLLSLSGQLIIPVLLLIPLLLFLGTSIIFAYVNRTYGERLNYYVTYHSSKAILEHLPQRPQQILTPKPTWHQAFITVMKPSEFAITFPSAPTLYVYYYDGGVWAAVKRFLGYPVPFFGLRIRTWAHLVKSADGHMILPSGKIEGNIPQGVAKAVAKVDLNEIDLITLQPQPSHIDLADGFLVIRLAMKVGSEKQVGAAMDKTIELHNALREESVIL